VKLSKPDFIKMAYRVNFDGIFSDKSAKASLARAKKELKNALELKLEISTESLIKSIFANGGVVMEDNETLGSYALWEAQGLLTFLSDIKAGTVEEYYERDKTHFENFLACLPEQQYEVV
jgi:hypothetical protein